MGTRILSSIFLSAFFCFLFLLPANTSAKVIIHKITVVQTTAGGTITPKGSGVPAQVSVRDGKNSTFTVTPKTGYHVVSILADEGDVTNSPNTTRSSNGRVYRYTFVNVTADTHTITAAFAKDTFTLTVNIAAAAGANGTVTAVPGTLACSGFACTGVYEYGSSVTLTGIPGINSSVNKWAGCKADSTKTTCAVSVKKDTSVTVKFTFNPVSSTPPSVSDVNVLPVTVNGSLCLDNSYPNKPCVSVTICSPGTSVCQTISDILMDTGSYGLRLFKQALSVPLVQETSGSGSLAECIQFADGSSDWGPVQTADVILGNEPSVEVPIQVIDALFGIVPSSCAGADQSPSDAGFNGILGVGPFVEDCGRTCVVHSGNRMYYSCNASGCVRTAVSLSKQVQNPVAFLPQDNNGVIVELPDVPPGGTPSIDGYLVLGIGTRSNNVPSSVKTYVTDQNGDIITNFGGILYSSFIDTGSNGLFFSAPASGMIPDCAPPNLGWFCPSSTLSFSAVNKGASGSPSSKTSFMVGNYKNLIGSSNNVFAEIGGDGSGDFDWGLPFHFGRNVYFGIDGTGSSLGAGPYFAY